MLASRHQDTGSPFESTHAPTPCSSLDPPSRRVFPVRRVRASRPACHFDATAESAKLLQRDVEWADAAAAGKDVDKIVSYWTDDAVLMDPGQPVIQGKQAIRAFITASLNTPGFKIHWVSEKPTFSPDGKMAYMRGLTELTVPGPKSGTVTVAFARLYHLED